jgi:hypothetical protein
MGSLGIRDVVILRLLAERTQYLPSELGISFSAWKRLVISALRTHSRGHVACLVFGGSILLELAPGMSNPFLMALDAFGMCVCHRRLQFGRDL